MNQTISTRSEKLFLTTLLSGLFFILCAVVLTLFRIKIAPWGVACGVGYTLINIMLYKRILHGALGGTRTAGRGKLLLFSLIKTPLLLLFVYFLTNMGALFFLSGIVGVLAFIPGAFLCELSFAGKI